MSQESVEVVRAAFGAWNAGDMDALPESYDPDSWSSCARPGMPTSWNRSAT